MSADAYDLPAERALLGSVISAPTVAGPILLTVPEDAWWREQHRVIAEVMADRVRNEQPIDLLLLLNDLRSRPFFDSSTGPYLHTLWSQAWNATHAVDYAERIRHCWARRSISEEITRAQQRLQQSWINGWQEPVTEFTGPLQAALEQAERLDAGAELSDEASPDADYLLAEPDHYDWLVPGLLERGDRMLLTGFEGRGKSTLISQISICLAAGLHPFSGNRLGDSWQSPPVTRVLVVDCENDRKRTRRRWRKIGDQVDELCRDQNLPVGDWRKRLRWEIRPEGIDLLGQDASWLANRVAVNQPELLVCGPLYKLHETDMNNEPAARGLVQVLNRLCVRHNCALITEAHSGHEKDPDGQRRMRPVGSSLFMRWPDYGFGLAPPAPPHPSGKNQPDLDPTAVQVTAWRGFREERSWPQELHHGARLPWWPNDEYFDIPEGQQW